MPGEWDIVEQTPLAGPAPAAGGADPWAVVAEEPLGAVPPSGTADPWAIVSEEPVAAARRRGGGPPGGGMRIGDPLPMRHEPTWTERVLSKMHGAKQLASDTGTQIGSTVRQTIAGMQLQALEELQGTGEADPSVLPALTRARGRLADEQALMAPIAARDADRGLLARGAKTAATSLAVAAPALGVGLATRSPALAAASLYPTTEGQKYGELREAGADPRLASRHAAAQGAIETGTELLPFGKLFEVGTPAVQRLFGFLVRELPGESVATLGQGLSDHLAQKQIAGEPVTERTVIEGLREAAKQLPETWVATVLAGGVQSGAVSAVDALRRPNAPAAPGPSEASPETTGFDPSQPFEVEPESTPGVAPPTAAAPTDAAQAAREAAAPTDAPAQAPIAAPAASQEVGESAAEVEPAVLAARGRVSEESYSAAIDRLERGELPSNFVLRIGMPSDTLRAAGLPAVPLHMTQQVVRKAMQRHGLSLDSLRHLDEQIQRPVAVFASKRGPGHRVVLTEIQAADGPVIAAIELEAYRGGTVVNDIRSVHPKSGSKLDHWVSDGLLIWSDSKRAPAFLPATAGSNSRSDRQAQRGSSSTVGPSAPQGKLTAAPKYPATSNVEATAATLSPHARSDGGNDSRIPPAPSGDNPASANRSRRPAVDDGVDKAGVAQMAGSNYAPMLQSQVLPQSAQAVTLGAAAGDQRTLDVPEKPIRRETVMREFQRAFNIKVYQGKPFKFRTALGIYRPRNAEIRVKAHNDLEVTAHEVWHWLDYNTPPLRALYRQPQFRQELLGVSYDAKNLKEGFAEFGRLYMTQEAEAARRAPQFYQAFVAEARRLGVYDKLRRVQDDMHRWYAQGAQLRAESKIGQAEPAWRERLREATDVDARIADALDWMQAAKVIERETAGDIAADATASPYKTLRLYAGSRSTIAAFLNHGTLMWTPKGDLQFSGKGLKQIFEPVADRIEDTMAYFVGRRAAELKGVGKERLFTGDEIEAMLARGRGDAEIERAFENYQKYVKRLMDFAQASGIVSGETRATWEAMYQNYVPFYRVSDALGATSAGGPTTSNPFKRLKGGTQNLADTFDNLVRNTAVIVQASLKNHAKTALFKQIEASPKGQRFAVRIPPDTGVVNVAMGQIEQALRKLQADAQAAAQGAATPAALAQAQAIEQAIATLSGSGSLSSLADQATFFLQGQPPGVTDKDSILVHGKRQWFQVADPLLWNMLQDLGTVRPLGLAERVLGGFKRLLTRGVTATPDFQIANLIRDGFNAYTVSASGQRLMVDALAAFKDIYTQSEAYREFLANGGAFGNATQKEGQALKLRLERLVTAKGLNLRAVLDTPAKIADFWDTWGQSFELATRLAEYKRSREKGASRREAAYRGREVSGDFAMHGRADVMRLAMTSLPFFNARLQGLYRLERELGERGGKQGRVGENAGRYALRAMLTITLPSLALYFRFKDDEDYEQLPDEVKYLNWVFPLGDGNVALMPKPFETGALFGTMPVALWERYAEGKEPALVEAAEFMLANTFSLGITPQVVKPIVDLSRNKSWTGAPIIPRGMENVAPKEQFTVYTAESMVRVGQMFGVSPIKLEYLVNGYLGTLGQYVLMASDALVSSGADTGERPARRLSQYPVIRRFLREQPYTRTGYERDFYDLMDAAVQVVDTAGKQDREGRERASDQYLAAEDNQRLYDEGKMLQERQREISQINADMARVRFDAGLTAEAKRAELDELQRQKNQMFADAVREMNADELASTIEFLENAE